MSTDASIAAPFWQLGIVVRDLQMSMTELSRALGVEWGDVQTRDVGEWGIEIVFSKQGPPYLELISGPPGSPWDGQTGSHVDHVGYWVESISAERQRLEECGFPVVVDGEAVGKPLNYHMLPATNVRVEPIAVEYKAALHAVYGLEGLD